MKGGVCPFQGWSDYFAPGARGKQRMSGDLFNFNWVSSQRLVTFWPSYIRGSVSRHILVPRKQEAATFWKPDVSKDTSSSISWCQLPYPFGEDGQWQSGSCQVCLRSRPMKRVSDLQDTPDENSPVTLPYGEVVLDLGSPWADRQSNMRSGIPAGLPGKLHWGCSGETVLVLGLQNHHFLPILGVSWEASVSV